ncbi:GGDEF domain-containing protein [Paractinoplanes rishiriensis]|uniref:GGDEF domain-containing protein n=1 Tax=Paractinoplanes rishiriensis TaxID=1050105 RepID=A0A919K280_9ACTN|nr:GGDEF domain-containing protein [Actinoplanes rishiriensis]GIE99345.1 hypothetical protein Ari01nite_68100 [Actinoplanes rishiriensis]
MTAREWLVRIRHGCRPHPVPRVRFIRAGARNDMLVPGLFLVYALATSGAPNRPVTLAVAVVMLALSGLAWWQAPVLAAPRVLRLAGPAGTMLHLLGAAALGLLDGGVGSPAGSLVLFALVIVALRAVRPGPFGAVTVVGAGAYGMIWFLGDPGPPGYAPACLLGFGGVAYLCLKHTTALASLRRRLARVSVTDPLTGALNRRGFDERLARDLADAERTGRPMTLLLADLDLFKQVNDQYGHQAGDHLLAALADRLGRELRAPDAVGRIGGDEFAAVLAGLGPAEAAAVVARLRTELAGLAPASIGHACFPADGSTLDELRRAADARVYADKQSRDRRPPSAGAVAAAVEAGMRPAVRVSGGERRHRSVADVGWMSMLGSACGLLYTVVFGEQHRLAVGVLATVLGLAGAFMVAAAGRLSRLRRAREVIFGLAGGQVVVIGGMAALDGGVTGVCALALLCPVPLVALTSPLRVFLPIGALFAAMYVAVAVLFGASSAWFVAMNLGGTALVCAVCAVQGRAAGRRRRRLTVLSRQDPLTEVLNRRGFEQAVAPAHRAVLVLDLDGFKQVNDRHGHEAGDDLLRWVAGTLTANLDRSSVVGRFGGDEFAVLLTTPDPEPVAERLRVALAERTRASIGTAVRGRDGDDFPALYAHADAALYAQKRGARSGECGWLPS